MHVIQRLQVKQHNVFLQVLSGVSRILIMGFPSSKKLQNIFGISSDQPTADNINFTGLYAEVGDMYLCVQCAKHPQHDYSRGLGACPQQKIFEN